MCGIAGAIGPDADPLTRRMTAALVHRGPDDDGFHSANGTTLGFRRLSIIDLEGGAQPILNETGDIALVCNGEIYNSPELRRRLLEAGHRFRTRTDVEVILHLYEEHGEDCVRHLRGMFAFAIWDAAQTARCCWARTTWARSPVLLPGRRALPVRLGDPGAAGERRGARTLDPNSLWHYLSLRSMPDECSMIAGSTSCPRPTRSCARRRRIRTRRYWTPDFRAKLKLARTRPRKRWTSACARPSPRTC
jgi:asparagine synthase (glutamine-hydrolysing)